MKVHNQQQLKRLGVQVVEVEDQPLTLECLLCGHAWEPELDRDGQLPPRYWLADCGHNNLLTKL